MTEERSLRRWMDKILLGAMGMVMALVGVVWGTMQYQVNRVDQTQRDFGERVKALEVKIEDVDNRLDRMETKLDKILEKVR